MQVGNDTVLVVDSEPTTRRFVQRTLQDNGFTVVMAATGHAALRHALVTRPRLILLDVTMSDVDGYELCRQLRADPRTVFSRVIFLTDRALAQDKVAGFAAGADDYLIKPIKAIELVARVHTTLQRSTELRAASSLTGLPGNHRTEREIADRLDRGEPLAVAYADLTSFKAFNVRYGFLRGDEVILATAELLWDALAEHSRDGSFLGHIGGDDFALLCHPDDVEAVCAAAVERFDARSHSFYDRAERAAGFLVVRNRRGELDRHGFMRIMIGVATTARRAFADHRELVAIATEMKTFLEQRDGPSAYAVDARVPA